MPALLVFLLALPFVVCGQGPVNDTPRIEDNFWRRSVLVRIDLREKFNRPLIFKESFLYTVADVMQYREGLVRGLLKGYRNAEFIGYRPDTLNRVLLWDEFISRLTKYALGDQLVVTASTVEESSSALEESDNINDDVFNDTYSGFGLEDEGLNTQTAEQNLASISVFNDTQLEDMFAGMNYVVELVEDRIFDKNKSDMYYLQKYFRLIWIDPEGILPIDVEMIVFRYRDVLPVLKQMQWKNLYNDAEYRTIQEVFELRLFHGFIVDVSGSMVRSQEEAEQRRLEMVEFEHNLWEF
jgi:Gliding motility associated protein GldN